MGNHLTSPGHSFDTHKTRGLGEIQFSMKHCVIPDEGKGEAKAVGKKKILPPNFTSGIFFVCILLPLQNFGNVFKKRTKEHPVDSLIPSLYILSILQMIIRY